MAEGNGLLNRRTGKNSYPGFESRPLRCSGAEFIEDVRQNPIADKSGFEPQKGGGKGFSHVVRVIGAMVRF